MWKWKCLGKAAAINYFVLYLYVFIRVLFLEYLMYFPGRRSWKVFHPIPESNFKIPSFRFLL